jgi:hypothetical protein
MGEVHGGELSATVMRRNAVLDLLAAFWCERRRMVLFIIYILWSLEQVHRVYIVNYHMAMTKALIGL